MSLAEMNKNCDSYENNFEFLEVKGSYSMDKNLHHLCIHIRVHLKEIENCLLVKEAYRLFPNSFPLMSGSTSVAPRYLATTTASVICR